MRQKHPFGRPPYFFAPAIITGSTNPLYQFKPLIEPMYQTTMELSMVRTARFNAAYLSSFKPFYVRYTGNGPEAQDEESGGLKIHFLMPGNEIPSLKGGEIVPIDFTNTEDLQGVEASLMQDRDRFGFQAILAGNQSASGDSTAWATRTLRDQGMIQFNGVLRNYAQMLEEEARFLLMLVGDVIKMDMPISRRLYDDNKGRGTVQTLKITKEMATAGFDIQIRLSAGKASDRIAIVEEFRRAHEAGEVPLRMVLEEGWGFQNVSQIMDEVVDEQIRQQMIPKAVELIFQVGVAGALDELQKLLPQTSPPDPTAMAQQAAAQGAPPPDGAQGGAPAPQGMPGEMNPGQPPSGEIPAGIVEPGMGQGLQSQNIPPEQPTGVPLTQ